MHFLLILLPLLSYLLLTVIFLPRHGLRAIAEGMVKAHLVIFVFITITTEFLSPAALLNQSTLVLSWLVFLLVALSVAIARRGRFLAFAGGDFIPRLDRWQYLGLAAILLKLKATLLTALLYPPTNWDSMTYHLARVMHWINNESVRFYTTGIRRQNYMMPLAEYAIMHLQLLTGADWFANLVQWMGYLLSIVLAALIAGELGLSKSRQVLSALLVAAIPMAILQASSTQTDMVASVFVLAFAYYMLRLVGRCRAEDFIFAAFALGLALLTKGTAALFCAGIGISLGFYSLVMIGPKRPLLLRAIGAYFAVIIFALLLNTGYFYRNYELHGTIISPDGSGILNASMSPPAFISNVVRNTAGHLGTPLSEYTNHFPYMNRFFHRLLGPEIDNPDTTYGGTYFRMHFSRDEDKAGNVLHMVLLIMAPPLLFYLWKKGKMGPATIWYLAGLVMAAVLYALVLRWQPWATRLHTPLFALAGPILALLLAHDYSLIKKKARLFCIALIVIYGFFFALTNNSRSLMASDWFTRDRFELYFQSKRNIYPDYRSVAEQVYHLAPGQVGLYIGSDDYEYPLWAYYLTNRPEQEIIFVHVGVENSSAGIDTLRELPPYVIAKKDISQWEEGHRYQRLAAHGSISLYERGP